ncbi:fimbrillin family protein [uncultured Bacteroides sp.]|uniref:fimbrillin family protein n=1 Tax=uncultured Bacteroides sp. TaxID=162156 RepID=UPI00260413EF|nr:fimbrillin family protein [uncultured Bacteroides sp.]
MKKSIFLLAAAAAAFASCTQNEVMEVAENRAIGFNEAADITSANFRNFIVYGGYADNTDLFNGVEVSSSDGSTWSYNDPRYWVVGTYNFAGYAPKANGITPTWDYTAGLTLKVNSDKDNQNDVIYASNNNITCTGSEERMDDVQLTFSHLLSKIQFKFVKAADLNATTVTMTNFKVGYAKEDGTTGQIITDGTWAAGSLTEGTTKGGYEDFSTGEVIDGTTGLSTDAYYVIPQTPTALDITANVLVSDGVTTITDGTISATLPIDVISSWVANNVYVYTATISINNIDDGDDDPDNDPKPIVFTGSVNSWDDTPDTDNVDLTQP